MEGTMVKALRSSKKVVRLLVIHESALYSSLIVEHAELLSHEHEIHCQQASTYFEASRKMQDWVPTAVLLDAYSTTVDCVKFLDEWGQGISQIFVVSDFLSEDSRNALMLRGAAEYITTGETPEEMESLLEKMVSLSPSDLALH
jgi:DNA-binding response OmpR family regulator